MLVLTAQAARVDVFVNNKPFKGQVSGNPQDLLLEAALFFKLAGGKYEFDVATGKGTLDGIDLELEMVGSTPMIRAKAYCAKIGGRYSFSPAINAVDVYAFDPVAAAHKALGRVIGMKSIDEQGDFSVLTVLTRQYLERDLGLKLDYPVELKLVDQEGMAAAGGGQLKTLVVPTGNGYKIYELKGQPPILVVNGVAWAWGATWAKSQGAPQDTVEAFGTWTAYSVLKGLSGFDDNKLLPLFERINPDERYRNFKKLVEIEQTGGDTAAVINYIVQLGGRSR